MRLFLYVRCTSVHCCCEFCLFMKKIQWIVCIIAILTNKCLWFTIISNIKMEETFCLIFSFFIFSCLFKAYHVGFELYLKAEYFFFVHLLPCLMFGFHLQLSSHILFEARALFLRFHLLIFVSIYRNLYRWGKNQCAQCTKSFFSFLAVCTSLEMKKTKL